MNLGYFIVALGVQLYLVCLQSSFNVIEKRNETVNRLTLL